MWILFTYENLRALWFKSSYVFLKRPPVYRYSNPVDQASICFVYKVYTFLHAWVYPVISSQQFITIGIIQWLNKHDMEFVLNFYVANLTLSAQACNEFERKFQYEPSDFQKKFFEILVTLS